jgi:hypothetical protein
MTDNYLRPRKVLDSFSRLYPDAWKQVEEFRARRKELGDWPDWCFLPLAGTYAIVSKGANIQSAEKSRHIGILAALAAWRTPLCTETMNGHALWWPSRRSQVRDRTLFGWRTVPFDVRGSYPGTCHARTRRLRR